MQYVSDFNLPSNMHLPWPHLDMAHTVCGVVWCGVEVHFVAVVHSKTN
jgi:hypothetical protein